ncbi:MAG TPA: hypothetical protein EYQ81_07300 [Sneathiellales bacterium]|nr:hypothetical protein [Sneathiellales bacterium]
MDRRNQAHSEHGNAASGSTPGPLFGSVVGIQKYVYDIFGPGVNLAARMEITLCEETYELIKDDFIFAERGEFEVKGFGKRRLYTLKGEHSKRR